jgi:RHS repeat-associated protein
MPIIIHTRKLFIACIRVASPWKLVSWLMFLCLLPALQPSAQAQALPPLPSCPDPWGSASTLYGTVFLVGTGMAKSPPYTQNVNQWIGFQAQMAEQFPCAWAATPGGVGNANDWIYINDTFTDSVSCGGPIQNYAWFGQGHGNSPQIQVGITAQSDIYGWGYGDNVNGTETEKGCINANTPLQVVFGPLAGIEEQMLPLPATGHVLAGSMEFSGSPVDPGSTLQGNWQLAWFFSTNPDDLCDDCIKKLLHLKGSELSIHNQDLGEDLPVIGTPFFLHYQSSRSFGRVGADAAAVQDARNLGGWTLSVHHALEPLLQIYCIGGSCTPYAIVPKALFMGDGRVRSDDSVQAPLVYNGNLYVTDEDGSEVYEFSNGVHTRTLMPMTGAVRYTFGYDPFSRLTSVTDESNNVTTIHRDSNGNPTAIVGPFGQTTTLAIDSNGFLSQITDPAGRATKLTNTSAGLLTTLTDPKGNVYNYQYDSFGRLTQHSDPAGGFVSLARTDNGSGYSVLETTAVGRSSTAQVGFSSNSSQTARQFTNTWTNGLQATESKTQLAGQLSDSTTLPDGSSYSTGYGPDPRWGIQVPVTASKTVTQGNLTMNISGNRTATLGTPGNPFSLNTQTDTTIVNGRTYTSVFDASNRTYKDSSPVGRSVTTTIDTKERLSAVQVAGLSATSFNYNSRGLRSAVKQGTRQNTYAYDSKGQLSSKTDALGLKTVYTYDPDGNVLSVTLPDGRVISYAYDKNGNLASVIPPGGVAHAFQYTSVKFPSQYTPPTVAGGGITKYSYNADRDLTRITRPDGSAIRYSYDSAGRLSSTAYPTASISYAYDATTGALASATVHNGEQTLYTYNGPLLTSATLKGTVGGSVSQTYNNNFMAASQAVKGGQTINFTYDDDNLLTQAGSFGITYSSQNTLLTGTAFGSAKDSRAYNSFGELSSYSAKYGTTSLYSVNYTRDGDAQLTAASENIRGTSNSWGYTYDNAGRLTQVTKNGASFASYTYDNNSNRLTATTSSGTQGATYDAQDRLLTYGSASYTYNANGELASETTGSQITTYQYDALGNLISAVLSDGTRIDYIIDAEINRVGKKVNGTLVQGFLYDNNDNIVAELDGSNHLVSQFVYATGSMSPDYVIKAGIKYRLFSDQLGSPRLVVNATTGAIAEEIDYDAFGNVLNDTQPGFQPFGFAGGLYDQQTGLVHFGAREYDPHTGRWTAKDPVLFSGGDTNLYGYVVGDPVNLADPAGLAGGKCAKAAKKVVKAVEKKVVGDKIKIPGTPLSISLDKPEISANGSVDIKVDGKTVGKVEGEVAVGVTTKGGPGDNLFYANGKVDVKIGDRTVIEQQVHVEGVKATDMGVHRDIEVNHDTVRRANNCDDPYDPNCH